MEWLADRAGTGVHVDSRYGKSQGMSGLILRHSGEFCERDYLRRDRNFAGSWRDEQGALWSTLNLRQAPDHETISAELANNKASPQKKYKTSICTMYRGCHVSAKD